MKTLFISFFVIINTITFSQELPFFGPYNNYSKGDTTYIYDDQVELKSKPIESSKTIKFIPMGTQIFIDSTIEVNYNIDFKYPKYYKVKYKGKTGYVKSNSLAIEKFSFPKLKIDLLFKIQNENEYHNLNYKEIYDDTMIYESSLDLRSTPFVIYKTDSRGLDSIECLIVIDYISEYCGAQGGEDYYSWTPMELNLIANLTSIGDGGVYSRTEILIFPADPEGLEKKIIYKAVEWEMIDEESEWTIETNESLTYKWSNARIEPEFGSEDNEE